MNKTPLKKLQWSKPIENQFSQHYCFKFEQHDHIRDENDNFTTVSITSKEV